MTEVPEGQMTFDMLDTYEVELITYTETPAEPEE